MGWIGYAIYPATVVLVALLSVWCSNDKRRSQNHRRLYDR
jgi:hypothetical protein